MSAPVIDKARTCAEWSSFIYERNIKDVKAHIRTTLPGCAFEIYFIKGCEVICLSLPHKKETWIICRGTDFETMNDLLANVNVTRTKDTILSNIWIHMGFVVEANKVWDRILQFVYSHACKHYHKLIFTGHSLGGAIALLMAARMAHTCPILFSECFTFGAPCIGGVSWAHWFSLQKNLTHIRFDHNNDIVPKLKSLQLMGYRHVGTRMYITHAHNLISRELTWKERLSDWLWGHVKAITKLKWFDSVRDHKMESYLHFFDTYNEQHSLAQ